MVLTTERLFIIPAGLPLLEAIVDENWAALAAGLGGVDLADHWLQFPEAMVWMRNFLREHPDEQAWWSYLVVHREDVRLIGTCGYKGYPTPEGVVEIGYGIAEGYQNRGLATETAGALIRRAFDEPGVRTVSAHTLAEENASCAVLRKLGFRKTGELSDPEDGDIWRWELERPVASSAAADPATTPDP